MNKWLALYISCILSLCSAALYDLTTLHSLTVVTGVIGGLFFVIFFAKLPS